MMASTLDDTLRRDGRRVVILDDDSTGTQASSQIDVILQPDQAAFERFHSSKDIGTLRPHQQSCPGPNARCGSSAQDCGGIECRGSERECKRRGHSSRRFHTSRACLAEIDALGHDHAVTLVGPAFPKLGRVTLDGSNLCEMTVDWSQSSTPSRCIHQSGAGQ